MSITKFALDVLLNTRNSPIYDGMKSFDKWSAAKRTAYFLDRRQMCEAEFRAASAKVGEKFNPKPELVAEKYRTMFLKDIFYFPEEKLARHRRKVEKKVISDALDYISTDNDLRSEAWQLVFAKLKTERIIQVLVPSLLTDAPVKLWDQVKPKRIARTKLMNEGRITQYRFQGTTQPQSVSRMGHMAMLTGPKKPVSEKTNSWPGLIRWIDNRDFSTTGTIFVTIDGLGEFDAGTASSQFSGGVDYSWRTEWRPRENA